jgi:hypothetical protein
VTAISPPERAGLANTLVPRDLSRGDGILGSSGLPKLISGHILMYVTGVNYGSPTGVYTYNLARRIDSTVLAFVADYSKL